MRQPLVAGNWKMNGSKASVRTLLDGIKAGLDEVKVAEVAVCPPFVYLGQVETVLQGEQRVRWGAQNLSTEQSGAYTGEISVEMLKDFGCTYVIVGHSERRALYGESDELVARKFAVARAAGVTPILCVGETLDEREQGVTEQVVARQLDAVIAAQGVNALDGAVVAYEPVWAIGTGRTATPEQAQEVHAFIRGRIAGHDADIAQRLRILYGGSMKGDNAADLLRQPDIDGGLVGGASLKADEFMTICRAAG
ncbi:triose-phosphate isomerase [Ectothiorhodospiraceae bacterium 2226]|nr:triose-phosphate isomerase [Ectothiorhodospiraceae bacterium 2226]